MQSYDYHVLLRTLWALLVSFSAGARTASYITCPPASSQNDFNDTGITSAKNILSPGRLELSKARDRHTYRESERDRGGGTEEHDLWRRRWQDLALRNFYLD
uniref:RxLR effector protein n=1 Tax=Craspedostauros australis TaxID=1486917 RepID=A0A7R9ZT88_9STRA|mmetsp:Transcript_9574/g.26046  ORF Transcript_9574/g.26046 Transcript_9574/m.26046 type:complete len:102 (+) Transcript_9574:156-461(+)